MSVRLTTTESDSTPPPPLPTPLGPSGSRVTDPAASAIPDPVPPPLPTSSEPSAGPFSDPGPPTEDPESATGDLESPTVVDSRRTLREARAHRRRLAWVCVAVVALCLALTIATVTLARYRSAAPPAPIASSTVFSVRSTVSPIAAPRISPSTASLVDRAARPTVPSRGAPAPEGGNP